MSNSPCAACKCLRRKCTQECVFAPYFPPDRPQKFISVHKVFGASNVSKLLNDLNVSDREAAVTSLAYEAEYRLYDPVQGCVGHISSLNKKLRQIQGELLAAKKELATYIGPSSVFPLIPPNFMQQHPNNPSTSTMMPYAMHQMTGMQPGIATAHGGQFIINDPHQLQHQHQQHHHHQQQQQQQLQQQQMLEAHQMAMAAAAARERQQEMFRSYEQQQQQQPADQTELLRFNSGCDTAGAETSTAFNQTPAAFTGARLPPPIVYGAYENFPYLQMQQQPPPDTSHSHLHEAHDQLQFESPIMLQQQPEQNYLTQAQLQSTLQPQLQLHSHGGEIDEGRSSGPSC